MKSFHPSSRTTRARLHRRVKAVVAFGVVLAMVTMSTALAGAQEPPKQPAVCFLLGSEPEHRVLTLVSALDDKATSYDVAKNVNGERTVIHTFEQGDARNMSVSSGAHFVRSKNNNGASRWLQCNSYRGISYVKTATLVDYNRPDLPVGIGLSGAKGKAANAEGTDDYRSFVGEDGDFVIVDVGDRSLEPGGKSMAYRAKFRISEADLKMLQRAEFGEYSWNIMQRGLASDPGGQWKMSLISDHGNSVRVQCTTRAEKGSSKMLQVRSEYDVSDIKITDGMTGWIHATCFSDDSARSYANGTVGDGLQIVVNGVASNKVVKPDLGTIDPNATVTCGNNLNAELFPRGLGYVVTIGNKPNCDGPITFDDRFRGDIAFAAIYKQ